MITEGGPENKLGHIVTCEPERSPSGGHSRCDTLDDLGVRGPQVASESHRRPHLPLVASRGD